MSPNATRNNLAFCLGHYSLLRGDNVRKLQLSDIYIEEWDNEASDHPCVVLHLQTRAGKTNKFAKLHQHGIMRAKEPIVCAHAALAADCFYRYHLQGDPFPDVSRTVSPATRGQQGLEPQVLRVQPETSTSRREQRDIPHFEIPETSEDEDEQQEAEDHQDSYTTELVQGDSRIDQSEADLWFNHQVVKGKSKSACSSSIIDWSSQCF